MATEPEPKALHSPLDGLQDRFEQSVHLKRQEVLSRTGPLEGAVRAYRLAVESSIARSLAASHSLPEPRGSVLTPEAAALELFKVVSALPELRARGAEQVAGARTNEAPPAKAELKPQSPAEGEASNATFPKIFALGQKARLVVVGALSGRRKSFPEPWADALEWLDTSSGGTHAVGNLATRIKQGRVLGLVICDGAIQHKHAEPLLAAARSAGVPVAFADKGGARGVLRAFETIEGQL